MDRENDNGRRLPIDRRGSGLTGRGSDAGAECVYCDSHERLALDSGLCRKAGGATDSCCGLVGWGCAAKAAESETPE